jgi:hypothetical protein
MTGSHEVGSSILPGSTNLRFFRPARPVHFRRPRRLQINLCSLEVGQSPNFLSPADPAILRRLFWRTRMSNLVIGRSEEPHGGGEFDERLTAAMLEDLKIFFDGQPFFVNRAGDLYFTPGGDDHSPLNVKLEACFLDEERTSYDLVMSLASVASGASRSLSGEEIELSVLPKGEAAGRVGAVPEEGRLRIPGLATNKHYVFSMGSGVLEAAKLPPRSLRARADA